MTTPRTPEQEARDPRTAPERLLELTQSHPELHDAIVTNPSCPEAARSWILATNPSAKQAFEQSAGSAPEAGSPSAPAADAAPAAEPETGSETETDAAPAAEPDTSLAPLTAAPEASVPLDAGPPTEPHEPVPASSGVRINEGSGVVALPPGAGRPSPDPAPTRSPAADADAAADPGDAPEVDAWTVVRPSADPASPAQPGPSTAAAAGAAAPAPEPDTAPMTAPPTPTAAFPAVAGAAAGGAVAGGAAAGGYSGSAPSAGASAPAAPAPGPAAAAPAGPIPWGTSGQNPPPSDGDGRSRRRVWWACGGCLLLALILAIVGLLAGRAWLSDGEDTYSRDSTTSASAEPSEQESSAAEEPSADPVSPAPDSAQELDAVASPTGNITCSLEGDSVGCSVAEHRYGDDIEGCADGPFSIVVAGEDAAPDCSQEFGSGAQTLAYGESAVNGDVACTSESSGMTCWNVMTGKGFTVSRSSYDTF